MSLQLASSCPKIVLFLTQKLKYFTELCHIARFCSDMGQEPKVQLDPKLLGLGHCHPMLKDNKSNSQYSNPGQHDNGCCHECITGTVTLRNLQHS